MERYNEETFEDSELCKIFDVMSKRFVKAVRAGKGMRLTPDEVHTLTCANWNTAENPEFDTETGGK